VAGHTVLIIGGGGREQALAWKLAQSPRVGRVYVTPGNGGSTGNIENVAIGYDNVPELLKFAQTKSIDLTVVGQEAASEAGVVDAFQTAGLSIFGPTRAAVKIESSKVLSKHLMASERIPTASYQAFSDARSALAYAKSRPLPVVIKADGLAEGKGVTVCFTVKEIETAITNAMVKKVFGAAGEKVVVEDFLKGQEVSVHSLCDGKQAVIFPTSQDYKQIYDGDKGPNTGGIGVIAPVPWVTPTHMDFVSQHIVQPALRGLASSHATFTGCLYPGLMIDGSNVKVVEFNARFGDPEAEVYMRLLSGDLFEILHDCTRGELNPASISWQSGYAVSVVLCSGGYPGSYRKGLPITGLTAAEELDDVVIFHAGTVREDGQILTNGGRVLNVTATGTSLSEALGKAYAAIKLIHFEGMYYRRDIGARSL
jgi:phosphoribosylamine--glycine ligase